MKRRDKPRGAEPVGCVPRTIFKADDDEMVRDTHPTCVSEPNPQSPGMVDIAGKDVTVRTAKAAGSIHLGPEAFDALQRGACPKGDVLATAKVAAIQAVKATPSIIPMCHPILVEGIEVDFSLDEAGASVEVTVAVKSSGKTGVEMEALHGVAAACLTIYDMLKYTGKDMTLERIQLLEKTGGRSGDYKRPD